ncbi:hypothetical protein EJ06DRAFT_523431 [Trichodelitschia bisporula]|uniref:Uncharacterized protein n=1 Tax=Trichodelitschia bisporula TaxID=703511 RepID=A0A6G1HQP4_9PEZI|nr:hypothetical protein EJ06DRAFT_523431 [Trichodelitschia bisporula]
MSDSEDGWYGDDADYFYVEDTYQIADDLAEHAMPSPPPFEGDDEWDDDWRFEYFNDIEYDDDDFYTKPQAGAGTKRKRAGGDQTLVRLRKRRVRAVQPVVWRGRDTRPADPKVYIPGSAKPYTLFKDWRERFKDVPLPAVPERPVLAKVEDAPEDDVPEDDGHDEAAEDAMDEWESDDEDIEDEDDETSANPPGLNPEILKTALRANLAKIGLDTSNVDEATLLQFATRMFEDMGRGEEILSELADLVLSRDKDSEHEDGFSKWVTGQVKPSKVETEPVMEGGPVAPSDTQPAPPLSPAALETEQMSADQVMLDAQAQAQAQDGTKATPSEAEVSHGRKRRASPEPALEVESKKLEPVRSFGAPTASSIAKATQKVVPGGKRQKVA